MRVGVVVGTRPEIIKTWSTIRDIESDPDVNSILIHTGQHYDFEMSQVFFDNLSIKKPDFFLETERTNISSLVSKVIEGMTHVLAEEKIDVLLVQGDTASCMAAGLAGVLAGVPIGHIEAGCRSYDRNMMEEMNRLIVDAASDIFFAPTFTAYTNLLREGKNPDRIFLVGSTTKDVLDEALRFREVDQKKNENPYVLTTIHRRENTDNRERLKEILAGLADLPIKCIFPVHPRTKKMIHRFDLGNLIQKKNLTLIDPQNYIQFMTLLLNASVVVTDSGGIQEEAALLGKTTLTVRSSTEWPETIWHGQNKLIEAKRDAITHSVITALKQARTNTYESQKDIVGHKIVEVLKKLFDSGKLRTKMSQMTMCGYPQIRLVQEYREKCLMRFDKDGLLTLSDVYEYAICEEYKKL